MAREIERKFLVASDFWRAIAGDGEHLIQGYFANLELAGIAPVIRVRVADNRGFLTIKGRPCGLARSEFEYEIPFEDAQAMLREFCGNRVVEKIRYFLPAGDGLIWEIDEYLEQNQGLFTAEIELPSEDTSFLRPEWLGEEVTGDPRYTNAALSCQPYSLWALNLPKNQV